MPCEDCLLCLEELRLTAVILRTYGEVKPVVARLISLNEQFVIVLFRLIGIFHQDCLVSLRLFDARDPYIHSASCQMIARRRASDQFVQSRRTIGAVEDDGLRRGNRALPISQNIALIITEAEGFQPYTEAFQILDGDMAGDIIHIFMFAFGKLL